MFKCALTLMHTQLFWGFGSHDKDDVIYTAKQRLLYVLLHKKFAKI